MRSFFTILLKTLLYTVLVLVLVLGSLVIGLQMPSVQTKIVQYAAKKISAKLQFPVDVRKVAIRWFDTVSLEGVSIRNRDLNPMVDVGRIEVNFDLKNLIDSSATNIHLDEVLLYRPDVKLVKSAKTGDLNFDDFLARINELLRDTTKPSIPNQNIPFTIGKATLIDGKLSYDDNRTGRMRGRRVFDYNHFTVNNLNAGLRDFLLLGDTIRMDINRLKGVDKKAQLKINRLDTRFLYCAKQMRLDELYASINGSTVRNRIIFDYNSFSEFGAFNDKVVMRINLRNATIRAQDLVPFTDYFEKNYDVARATLDYAGTVRNFRTTKADIRFGRNSRLVGDLAFKGLPSTDPLVDFRFGPSSVQLSDLRPYYSDPAFDRMMGKLQELRFNATFAGRFLDFRTVGTFNTALGGVAGDFALKMDGDNGTTYRGNLRVSNFDAGTLFDQSEQVQRVDGTARFNGRGLAINTAQLDIDARINRLGFRQYNYRNLIVRGNLQQKYFDGQISVRDTNLNVNLDGEFNLRGQKNFFDLRGIVRRADLLALNLSGDSLVIHSDLNAQLTGNRLDELVGSARFYNSYLTLGRRSLVLDTLVMHSELEGRERSLTIESDIMRGTLLGNYQITQAIDDIQRLAQEYRLNFAGDAAGMAAYYRRKRPSTGAPYSIDYALLLKNMQPLTAFLAPSLYISPNTQLFGRFTIDRTSLISVNGFVDTLRIGDYSFYKSSLDLTTSKFVNSPEVIAALILNSKRQQLGGLAPTEQLDAEASWDINHIDFTSSLKQVNSTNRANLNGSLTFKGDAMDIELRNSRFRLLDSLWRVAPDNLIRVVGNDVTIRNLSLSNHSQLIAANGRVSSDTSQVLKVEARNFLLQSLNPVLNTSISGTANGEASLRDLYGLKLFDGSLQIDSLKYQNYLIGNLFNRSTLDPSRGVLIDTRVSRDRRDVLTVTGAYDPGQSAESPLDLKARLNGASLRLLEPFAKGYISNLNGTATGTVDVTGNLNSPELKGTVDVKDGRLRIDYLKADMTFADKIYFEENEIRTQRMVLTDPEGNKATLRGGVFFPDYRYFVLDLTADMNNFRILNTTAKDNDLFYGTAVATGKVNLYGPIDNLNIRADVASNRGTRIFIPLDQAATVTDEDVIRFINTKPSAATPNVTARTSPGVATPGVTTPPNEPQVDLSGINMDFNLSITPDAYCEIQLDRQTGDIIKANGSGQIAMRIDTKGDFTMTGTYEIQRGEYTFTFENVINKKFQMLPDSRITWTGDPYEAMVDVKTAYTQYASLRPLFQGSTSQLNAVDQNRRYPVDLLIDLKGRLLKPEITYDLKVREYPQLPEFRQQVTAFESRIKSNDQELGRQVSSILLFSQLLPPDGGFFDPNASGGGIGVGVTNSLSELLSNQLSRLASTINKNLDVGLSLNGLGLDQNMVNNLQVRLSYRFNDRFRISRDGGFTYGNNQTNTASLLGEWTLEYWVTQDGRLKLKMYNRNQMNLLGSIVSTGVGTFTTGGGMSVQYTRSFNTLFGKPAEKPNPGLRPVQPDEKTIPAVVPTGTTTASSIDPDR
ncbi:translocation/assembly module TamB domain-containing protein [Tellurirhabdus rosea]|uniref:translocation/assembly module TamB domain-containing protein n=1 Tax=Tellurirhabdus rosea TaxID=2674997 RepID=UPI00224E3CE1|nr:translocation/assembly module TamB domain-containing protein [Tellurirhabdus rosea]